MACSSEHKKKQKRSKPSKSLWATIFLVKWSTWVRGGGGGVAKTFYRLCGCSKWKLYLYWVILGNHEYRKEIILVPKWGFKAAQQLSHRIPTVSPSLGDQNSISLQVLHWSRSGVYTSLLLRAWYNIPLGLQRICLLAGTWSWMVCSYLQIPNYKITVGLYFGNLADRSVCTVKKNVSNCDIWFSISWQKKCASTCWKY